MDTEIANGIENGTKDKRKERRVRTVVFDYLVLRNGEERWQVRRSIESGETVIPERPRKGHEIGLSRVSVYSAKSRDGMLSCLQDKEPVPP